MKTKRTKRISPSEIIEAEVNIGDPCSNGYDVINCSYSIYSKEGSRRESKIKFEDKTYWMISFGSGSETILKHFPELAPVVKVNGCDLFGFRGYPIMNTLYHCQNTPETAGEYHNLNEQEVSHIADLNELAVAKFMYKLSQKRYMKDVKKAVELIETLVGEKYTQKEHISHKLENDIVYCCLSQVPKKERGWNLLKGQPKPTKYSIDLR